MASQDAYRDKNRVPSLLLASTVAGETVRAVGDPITGGSRTVNAAVATYYYTEDTSFVSSDSPAILDVATGLGRNSRDGFFSNDGAGDIKIYLSSDGTTYGSAITIKGSATSASGVGEVFSLLGIEVSKIKVEYVTSASAYRVYAI